jgi:hypothetical protein
VTVAFVPLISIIADCACASTCVRVSESVHLPVTGRCT